MQDVMREGVHFRDCRDKLVGFRCVECGCIYESGWGNICNTCRDKERRIASTVVAMIRRKK